ncbi:unnamed protein product, partial [Amoebophrya sp. A25]
MIQNRETLLKQTNVFARYFPVILKLVVFHPRIVAQEVLSLLPAMANPSSMAALFHQILDLPLTAAFVGDEFLSNLDAFAHFFSSPVTATTPVGAGDNNNNNLLAPGSSSSSTATGNSASSFNRNTGGAGRNSSSRININ